MFSPVIGADSSDARKNMVLATSSGSTNLPRGLAWANSSITDSGLLLNIGVSVGPGFTLFTRMPYFP